MQDRRDTAALFVCVTLPNIFEYSNTPQVPTTPANRQSANRLLIVRLFTTTRLLLSSQILKDDIMAKSVKNQIFFVF